MSKLFESNRQIFTFPTTNPGAKMICQASPIIQYEQIRLNDLQKQYLEIALAFKKVFRTRLQTPLLKISYKLVIGVQPYTISFGVANKKIDWLEISLVYDKSDQNNSICDN